MSNVKVEISIDEKDVNVIDSEQELMNLGEHFGCSVCQSLISATDIAASYDWSIGDNGEFRHHCETVDEEGQTVEGGNFSTLTNVFVQVGSAERYKELYDEITGDDGKKQKIQEISNMLTNIPLLDNESKLQSRKELSKLIDEVYGC